MTKASLKDLADDYFNFLAKSFPVMCANDEFHFLPRAQAAGKYLDRMENLQKDSILDVVSFLKEFRNGLDRLSIQESDIEGHTDVELLKSSVAGALLELELYQTWRHNPLLYLKISFMGLDQAISKPFSHEDERRGRIQARLEGIPRLLRQAMNNLERVPETYLHAARAVLKDCRLYLQEIGGFQTEKAPLASKKVLHKTLDSLNGFDKFLQKTVPVHDRIFFIPAIKENLKDYYLSFRTLPEISQLAEQEMQECLMELEKLGSKVDPEKSWLELYDSYLPDELDKIDTMSLYEREIESLSLFFQENEFPETGMQTSFELCETPTYLRSIRSSASFSAALNTSAGEKDFFYITTNMPGEGSQEEKQSQKNRLHREYKFLSAHEVIPGHHQLDYERRKQKNLIRRQIESPLFYEGWASYAETLLSEYGYVEGPLDRLIDYKRRLWRAARCKIDVGLNAGILSRKESLQILTEMGFTPGEAERQVNRIQLSPGYQLCYFLGRYEIMNLRKHCGRQLGLGRFHQLLLEGGELPFRLIEKRLKAFGADSAQSEED
jgi:hypothetical protein